MVILVICLYLVPVGIKYAASAADDFQMNADSFGSMKPWAVGLTMIVVVLVCKFCFTSMPSNAAMLIGIVASYILAFILGMVTFGEVANASWIVGL